MEIKFECYQLKMAARKDQLKQVMISVFVILLMVACYVAILFIFSGWSHAK